MFIIDTGAARIFLRKGAIAQSWQASSQMQGLKGQSTDKMFAWVNFWLIQKGRSLQISNDQWVNLKYA